MATAPTNVGIIGCGNISSIYFESDRKFKNLNIVACADIDMERARAQAAKYKKRAITVEELLADPTIEIVVNLTVPNAHGEVGLAALQAGKSVYNEKPLATRREDAQRILEIAQAKGLRVGGAPDTFLGGGLQTCRKLIDEGAIGTPVHTFANMLSHGMEGWHPNPDFFFKPGGGPMLDMGPYYLTALVSMIGPARRVSGSARITHAERTITSKPRYGEKIVVETPTHITGIVEFANGAVATIVTTWDVAEGYVPELAIYGTEGTLRLPDPNNFGGRVRIKRTGSDKWEDVKITHGFTDQSRGIGVADMAYAMRTGRQHRANGELAYHVLDVMMSIMDSARKGRHIELASTCERPDALPANWPMGEM